MMIANGDITLLKKLIGKKIKRFGSTAIHFSDGEIESLEINMLVDCGKISIVFEPAETFGFFENEDGDVFYDYNIVLNLTSSPTLKSTIEFNTPEIVHIDVYGRNFDANEFIDHPNIYNKFKGQKTTDDLFVFNCKDEYNIMMFFHPYMPGIKIYFDKNKIKNFWDEYGEKYCLSPLLIGQI